MPHGRIWLRLRVHLKLSPHPMLLMQVLVCGIPYAYHQPLAWIMILAVHIYKV